MSAQPATAHASGGIASAAMGALLGGGGAPLPSISASSSARSGDLWSTFGNDASGFQVNYGGAQSAGVSWLMVGALVVAALLWKKRST